MTGVRWDDDEDDPRAAEWTPDLPSDGELSFGEARAALRSYRSTMQEALAQLEVGLAPEEEARLRAQFADRPDHQALSDAMVEIYQVRRRNEVYWAHQFARRSFVVIVLATMETQARTFCDALFVHRVLEHRWKHSKGSNVLDRLDRNAFELAGLKKDKLPETLWLSATRLEQIRHCITHANGEVTGSRDEQALRSLVGQFRGYQLDAEDRIVLEDDACDFAIEVFSLLFLLLYKQAKLPGRPLR